jgi:hypothetical protein
MPPLEVIGSLETTDSGPPLAIAGPLHPKTDVAPQEDSGLAQLAKKYGWEPIGHIAKEAVGVGEAAAHVAGELFVNPIAQSAAGLAGLGKLATTGSPTEMVKTIEGVQGAAQPLTVYNPLTEAGKRYAGAADTVLDLPARAGEKVGDVTQEVTGSPVAGALADVAAQLGIGALAGKVISAGVRAKLPSGGTLERVGASEAEAAPQASGRLSSERGAITPFAETEAEKALRIAREQRAATETGDPLEDLATTLKRQKPTSVPQRLSLASRTAARMSDARDTVGQKLGQVQAGTAALHDMLTRYPPWTDFKDLLGKWQGALQFNNIRLRDFAAEMRRAVPDKMRREAMTNYIQAAGDPAVLQQRAAASRGTTKLGYELATQLTADERALADKVRRYHERRLEQAINAGLLDEGVENYVRQSWQKPNPFTQRLVTDVSHRGDLKPNPDFIKKRLFDSYFEGEQAGYTPTDKDVGYLVASYDQAFNRALAARGFVKALSDAKAADGRPVVVPSGSGHPVEGASPDAYMIRGVGPRDYEKYGDYLPINHPALRKWTWATQDEAGNPIFVKGDLLVHPKHWRHLRNALQSSALRRHPLGRALLAPSMLFKDFRLALSLFHPGQLAEHATMHKVNPFNTLPVDIENPIHRGLIEHGLQVAAYDGMEAFAEGLHATGLKRVPLIGPIHQRMGEWLFQDYIPRLKVTLGEEALKRNAERYPNLTHDQHLELTANQVNAAFGELNYKMLARHPTTQDIFRLIAFAPDFLEARGRFVGQALKPYGREQAAALIRGAAGMYFAARVLNKVLDDDYHWNRPFSVVHNGREYTLRTIQGDIVHLLTDPRSFAYFRLNPVVVRPALEALTGRDAFGRTRDLGDQLRDLMPVPIPFESLIDKRQRKLWESMLQGLGVTEYKYRSDAEQLAAKAAGRHMGDMTPAERESARSRAQIRDELRQGASGDLDARVKAGELTPTQAQRLRKESRETDLVRRAHYLSVPDLVAVWNAGTAEERRQLRPIISRRLVRQMPIAQRTQLLQALKADTAQEAQEATTH